MNVVMTSDAMHGDPALGPEGRRYPRSENYQARGVNIEIRDYASPVFAESQERSRRMRTISGTLIDLNPTGLGVRTLCPLAVGSIVLASGELHSPESCVRIDARARVAHCRCQADESFRVGLNFIDIKQQYLECSHDPGFSLEGD
jgi:PilZ domain